MKGQLKNDWKVVIDDELICDSKHYENVGFTFDLKSYNAYDDKGNKIEGEYITLTKKEYDNIIQLFNRSKLCLRYNNGGIAYTFDDEIKEIVCEIFRKKKDEVLKEIEKL